MVLTRDPMWSKEQEPSELISVSSAAEKGSRAWIFAGGDFQADGFDRGRVLENDLIVGVDHGIAHCLAVGLVPDILLGDLDSVDDSVLGDRRLASVQRRVYPTRKNSSDLELAMEWAVECRMARIILIGISGGRSDHHFANWMLPSQARWPFAIELIDATVHAHVVTPQHPLTAVAHAGQTISLMPMTATLGVTTKGLAYPLHDAQLNLGGSLGLSNIASETRVNVSLSEGRLLVLFVKADETTPF